MARESKIEWTDATFNPWMGCEKVAPECEHCYAETLAKRMRNGAALWQGERRRTSAKYWAAPLVWAKTLPAELGRRPRVFCASLADVFDNKADPSWRVDLFRLIHATPQLDWLLLTKRIGNAARMIEEALVRGHLLTCGARPWPWPNVWLGITAGTQEALNRDAPKLLATPAAVRFLSMEPLLEPVDLRTHNGQHGREGFMWAVDWVIAGGESGANARPMHPDWVRAIRDQCAAAGRPFLFKQWGEWAPYDGERDASLACDYKAVAKNYGRKFLHLRPDGADERDGRGATCTVVRIGKKAAGRHFAGQLHDGFPGPRYLTDHRGHAAGEGNFAIGAGLK